MAFANRTPTSLRLQVGRSVEPLSYGRVWTCTTAGDRILGMVDPTQLKALAEKLSPEDRAALDHLFAVADSDGDGRPDVKGVKALFFKDGEFSKTSTILVLAWTAGLSLWLGQGLGAGASVFGHVIPAFDSAAALAMLGAASSLYFATHNIKVGKSDG